VHGRAKTIDRSAFSPIGVVLYQSLPVPVFEIREIRANSRKIAIRERARLDWLVKSAKAPGARFPIPAIATRRGCNYTRERRVLRSAAVVAYEY